MAGITTSDAIASLLKIYYKDGVENLFFRDSPVLKMIEKERVEGKQTNFAALYGRGGAVSGDYTKARAAASETARNVEYQVCPGQIFSVYTLNAKEVQMSLTSKGAYMKVGGNKMFAASEAFRKTMDVALYGSGYGEICTYPDTVALVENVAADITLSDSALQGIDIGSVLSVKTSVTAMSVSVNLTVNAINGNVVNVTPSKSYTPNATDVICLAGSMDANGNPLLPLGFTAWLPVVAKRTGANWTNYIKAKAFGVDRSIAADRLAGQFIDGTGDTKKVDTVQKLLKKVRRAGSKADMIIMNDQDWLDVSKEIESTNTYFTQTSSKGKKSATVGFDSLAASFSTNFIDNIIDDPACPQGMFFILDKGSISLATYTNVDKLDNKVAGNEPGKQEVEAMANEGTETDRNGLIIDDYLNVQPGAGDINGPSVEVALQMFGSLVVRNPSINGVGLFAGTTVMNY